MSENKKTEKAEMDPTVPEHRNPVAAVNNERVCWALQTLVAEVQELFPETPVDYGNPDGRNTLLDGQFDLTALDGEERADLASLLGLTEHDSRIETVVVEDDMVLVSIRSNPRTQDKRDPFGLGDALGIMADSEGSDGADPAFLAALTETRAEYREALDRLSDDETGGSL